MMNAAPQKPPRTFTAMQSVQNRIEAALARLGIDALNPMQESILDASATHSDIIIRSPTGSGKTLGFLLPVLRVLDAGLKGTQAMIIVPSRELAQQIDSVWKQMGTGFKVTLCYGGHKREIEENNLTEPPALIIGTPGRLADHIRRGNITTDTVHTLVLDEFDKSLELGFEKEMAEVVSALKDVRMRMLCSATEAVTVPSFVGMHSPLRLEFEGGEQVAGIGLDIQVLHAEEKDKLDALYRLLCHIGARPAIIFLNHRESVARTATMLKERGLVVVFYHGAMEQDERDAALARFRNGSASFLVTTDLAARGLDIAHIRYIIHYHLPPDEASFTHRNGRTARMHTSGTAVLVVGPEERVPSYINEEALSEITLPDEAELPDKPQWVTLYVSAGKKDKVNKVDIVGFLTNIAALKKEDIGLIEVKDFFAFVAIRRSKANAALEAIKGVKLKGKKVKIGLAR
jgi:ATP-independent RNA helicase DbpA